ncbi:Long-chain fatty acid transport protein 4 [Portunus trituberculatus]|uniref:Long-chain fatty acid transport protein 4 n=1 Tax=Portunus trituberculatus TaxID=210409 RepID=A0A5B7ENN8_PORTR|nr:Long-chain fatty acid transport protein 4 [Portunus trituberculatus]
MALLRMAVVVGAVALVWGASLQEMSLGGWTVPPFTLCQLLGLAALVYIACGGYYTLWLVYMTLPRDLRAGIRYLKVLIKLKTASYFNSNIPKLFMENVRKNPNKVALIFEDQKWTFAQPFGEETRNAPKSDSSLDDDLKCLDTSLNFFYINFCNIHSLRSNFQSVEHHLFSSKPHLLFLTETQLSQATDKLNLAGCMSLHKLEN